MKSDDRRLLDEQIEYYRRRAPEYDRTSTPPDDPLAPQVKQIHDALRAFNPRGRVLELACGTGQWTIELVTFDAEVTAVDSAPEMLELNRQKVGDPTVRYTVADVFTWEPDDVYDVVFFGFWLSHVPTTRFEQFWNLVARCLAPEGRVFFVDETRAGDWRGEDLVDDGGEVVRRRLNDGSEHRAIKVFWDAEELERRLRKLGWAITVRGTGAFLWGEGGLASMTYPSS
jgi:ubiquinone/menaquinone biosynthesis C-methylase UbiE